jgi:hypothetical protein
MKTNTLKIIIHRSVRDVFSYYINPKNTPLWWIDMIKEETSEWPIQVGTVYKDLDKKGNWSSCTVEALKENELFQLISSDTNYHVRYTHNKMNENTTELIYYEWVDKGDIEKPFTIDILQRLKQNLEK